MKTPVPASHLQLAPPGSAKLSNLAFALCCLPVPRRKDALIFFRFCRAVDDLADNPSMAADDKRWQLLAWREAVESGGLPGELERVISMRGIDRAWLSAVIDGCLSDVGVVRFPDMGSLRAYCWKVACAVGLASTRIFGCRDPSATAYAEHLGYALQFTNILRDIAEDAKLNRIYLPQALLAEHGCNEMEILRGTPGAGFPGVAGALARAAQEEFALAVPPQGDRRALLPAEIMSRIYQRLLSNMRRDDFRVFARRYRVSKVMKIAVAFRTRLAG